MLLPKDTKIVGQVTETQARGKQRKKYQLAIAFDHAVLKDGEAMKMPMSIQAIIAPLNANPSNASTTQPTTGSRKTGGGSAAHRNIHRLEEQPRARRELPTNHGQLTHNADGRAGAAARSLATRKV